MQLHPLLMRSLLLAAALLACGPTLGDEGIVLLMDDRDALCPIARVVDGKVEPASLDDAVRLGFRQWLVQVSVVNRTLASSAVPALAESECTGEPYLALDSHPGAVDFGIAFGGLWPAAPEARVLEPSAASYALLDEVLAHQYAMPPGTPLKIGRVILANLDGDSEPERLIEASWTDTTAVAGEELLSSGYDLLILADVGQPPRWLAGTVWADGDAEEGFPIEVLALADVDGDGQQEIFYVAGGVEAVMLGRGPSGRFAKLASCFYAYQC